ncbi:NADH-quinone oxidoreductase subunit J [Cereibacter sphaeroides]|uniref:NADH-quinone oxidoreductase subunit J family protein n=1 Tax=Cereibacter sphaeroides TaxID=1063 RepID=UPI000F537010|nr:NADH-quinone oxidoreductase subunit J [Cereibacter sphaeroides]AZB63506.1 NADH-quinone oxidoreductase subunit J [Cereibacter sphaeroides]AZB68573.1 NADH-quinone oxidoreductase subunit J [Cereibacter sphaeroides]
MSDLVAVWCASVALASAILAVTRPAIVHALIWLVAALLSLAGSFFALGASFAGAVQILIYAGAIVAVFVFVVMTADASPEALARERARLSAGWKRPAAAVALVAVPLVLGLLARTSAPEAAPATGAGLGAILFGPWALAVEVASGLLLAALMGARHLGRRREEP